MTLEELFQRLSYGPLSNLAVANEGSGGIVEAKKPAMVHYTNEALLRLHTRFVLIERALILKQVDGISNYALTPEHTYTASISSDPPAEIAYIQDSAALPFKDDLIKILRVLNSCGCDVPLNNENACGSYFTPQNHILQIPCPTNDELTYVVYQARHKKLEARPADLKQLITLPATLEEALLAYISYLHFSSMNGQENIARAAELLNRYNSICGEAESHGIVNTDDTPRNNKLCQRGFV